MGLQKEIRLASSLYLLFTAVFLLNGCSTSVSESKVQIYEKVSDEVQADNYLSGSTFCSTYKDSFKKSEKNIRVSVPKDYNHPELGSLSIYAFFAGSYKPDRPTVLFVDGGPGQTSHTVPYFMVGFNQLHFDQRGLGCSAPDRFEDYKNQNFYTTEFIARDMKNIIEEMGLSKVSVYGVSYGTAPATVFANMFPESVRSVTLEGVMYSGDYVFTSDLVKLKLQNLYDSLEPKTQKGIDKLSLKDDTFFPNLIRQMMYMDKALINAKDILDSVISEDGQLNAKSFRKKTKSSDEESKYSHPQNPEAIDRQLHAYIFCNELKMSAFKDNLVLKNKRIVKVNNSENARKYCEMMGATQINSRNYEASDYPVTKPIYYFQGADDGATVANGALLHWKTVPQEDAYFMLHKGGGHNTNLESLMSKSADTRSSQSNLFNFSLLGKVITADMIDTANKLQNRSDNQKWYFYTDRGSEFESANRATVGTQASMFEHFEEPSEVEQESL